MKSKFEYTMQALVAAVACAGMVGCGGSGGGGSDTTTTANSSTGGNTNTGSNNNGNTNNGGGNNNGGGGGGTTPTPPPPPPPPPPAPPQSGSLTLDWVAPTTNSDGSALTDLAGFRIYYGTSPGVYTKIVTINNAYTSNWTLTSLPVSNTYYVVVKAFDTSNNEGPATPERSKAIP